MNDNSKKRKKSFANDRLKRLRTDINNDVISKSLNVQKPVITPPPSVKSNITHNQNGYPERKKLIPVRKLNSNNTTERYAESLNTLRSNNINNHSEPYNSIEYCPKRRKIDVATTKSSSHNTSSLIRRSRGSTEKSGSSKCDNVSYPNPKNSDSVVNKRSSSFDFEIEHPISSPKVKDSSISSRLQVISDSTSKNFPEICSKKKQFDYQHKESPLEVIKKSIPSDTTKAKDYLDYFGKALYSLYGRLFGSEKVDHDHDRLAHSDSMDWEPNDDVPSSTTETDRITEKKMYIIVDTNIFLDSLSILDGIIKYGSKEGVEPVIFVPWMVFNELDFIKDNRSSGMKSEASKAIDFINRMLIEKDGKLIGQSIFEANKQMYVGKSPDDKIASCCLQVKEKGFNAVLLSNDKNLRNKLIINGIPSISCGEFLKNFDDESPHEDKIKVLLDEMNKCCTAIIIECCEEAYGNVWNKLALLEKQPWDFKMCLDIFKRYWSAVFRDKLLKQFSKTVEKMIESFRKTGFLKDPSAFENFAKDCLSLCFFLMDLEQHKDLIKETTKKINLMIEPKT